MHQEVVVLLFYLLWMTLFQLGIWDVFDPRRADLSGMSDDPELYVRNIEQSVTVVIRNYVKILDIQTSKYDRTCRMISSLLLLIKDVISPFPS